MAGLRVRRCAFFVGLVSLLDFIKGEFLVALDAGKYIGML